MRKPPLVMVICAVSWFAGAARAQIRPEAEKLFRDGKALMKAGKFADACAMFEASEKAEHNVATVLSLADCREKNQQYASAWALFLQADSQTRSDPSKAMLNKTAESRALALESKLSYLTINVPDESRIPELVVTRDGAPVDPAEWNRSIPVDGGDHVIAGKAPGHESWSTKVTIKPEADKQSVEVPRFKALPEIVNKPAQPDTARNSAEQTLPPVAEPNSRTTRRKIGMGVATGGVAGEPSPWTTRRKIGMGMAAGGGVAAGVAIYFGLDARSLHSDAVATCPPSACSPAEALDAQDKNDRARSHAMIANIGFGAAGAAVAVGAVLWFIGTPESPNAVAVAPQVGAIDGLAIMGRF